jgi:catecholate siderophore receptor
MKRGTKTRWNPVDTIANVTDLTGTFRTGGVVHSVNAGLELSREKNRNAAYSTFTTAGAACPAGFVLPAATAASLGQGDCTRVYAPDPDDAWTGVINRGPISRNTTESVGVYALDSLKLTERLILNLGLRWDRYAVEGVNRTATQTGGVFGPVTSTDAPRAEWDFVNYQVGLVFKPTPDSSLYASYATSATPPTISAGDQNTAATPAIAVLAPEETESYEIGAKANLFGDRLALSAAAFMLKRENAQIQVSPGVFEQAGEAEVKGVELGVSGNITREWQVFGGYTWMDSELVSGAFNNVNVGDPLANTPEHTFSLFTTYRVVPSLSIGGGVYSVSDSFGGNQGGAGGGANRVYAPAYTRLDLFASYDVTDAASLQLNVQNATDEDYIMRTNGVHHADVGPGRQAILTLNLRY